MSAVDDVNDAFRAVDGELAEIHNTTGSPLIEGYVPYQQAQSLITHIEARGHDTELYMDASAVKAGHTLAQLSSEIADYDTVNASARELMSCESDDLDAAIEELRDRGDDDIADLVELWSYADPSRHLALRLLDYPSESFYALDRVVFQLTD